MRNQVPQADKNENERPIGRKNFSDIQLAQIAKQKQDSNQDN